MSREERINALVECGALLLFQEWFELVATAFVLKVVKTLTPEKAYADYLEETLQAYEKIFER